MCLKGPVKEILKEKATHYSVLRIQMFIYKFKVKYVEVHI